MLKKGKLLNLEGQEYWTSSEQSTTSEQNCQTKHDNRTISTHVPSDRRTGLLLAILVSCLPHHLNTRYFQSAFSVRSSSGTHKLFFTCIKAQVRNSCMSVRASLPQFRYVRTSCPTRAKMRAHIYGKRMRHGTAWVLRKCSLSHYCF